MDQVDRALQLLERGVTLAPSSPEAAASLANVFYTLKRCFNRSLRPQLLLAPPLGLHHDTQQPHGRWTQTLIRIDRSHSSARGYRFEEARREFERSMLVDKGGSGISVQVTGPMFLRYCYEMPENNLVYLLMHLLQISRYLLSQCICRSCCYEILVSAQQSIVSTQ